MKNKTLTAVGLWLIAAVLMLVAAKTYQFQDHFFQPRLLPAAGSPVLQAPEGLGILAGTALQHNMYTRLTKTIRLHERESQNFEENFFNIAAQRGWFAHSSDHQRFTLVLPQDELPELDMASANPTGWILEHRKPGLAARGPSDTTNLINVRIDVETTGKEWFHILSGTTALLTFGSLFTGFYALFLTWELASQRMQKEEENT